MAEADGDGRVLILPTASAPEGKDVFERWGSLGLAHFSRLDIPAEVLELKTREDTDDPRLIERLEGASAVYFSGGNPAYLSATLAESDFLDALVEAAGPWDGVRGLQCRRRLPQRDHVRQRHDGRRRGLQAGPRARRRGLFFAPHWDMVDTWIPGATEFLVASAPEGFTFIGMDEDTAMVGADRRGRSSARAASTSGRTARGRRIGTVTVRARAGLTTGGRWMDEMYHEGNRELQDRFDTRRLADRIENLLVHETFTDRDRGVHRVAGHVLPRFGR